MRHVAVALLLLSAVALPAWAQTGTITIRGRVVADESGDPIANARVAMVSNVPGARVVLTDGGGQFALTAPSGAFRLVVSKTGYARQEVTRPAADQRMEIRLQRSAVVSGSIVDEFGDPVQGARVAAQPAVGPTKASSTAETDDLGARATPSSSRWISHRVAVARLPEEGADAWRDSEFLNGVVRFASTITVRDGEMHDRPASDRPIAKLGRAILRPEVDTVVIPRHSGYSSSVSTRCACTIVSHGDQAKTVKWPSCDATSATASR
jgi:hypothetical protein